MKKLFAMALMLVCLTASADEFDLPLTNENGMEAATPIINDEDPEGPASGVVISDGGDDDCLTMHVNVGVDIPTNTGNIDFAPFRSWEIGWTLLQYDYNLSGTNSTLSAGLGVDWRNYTLSGHENMFTKVGDVVGVYPETTKDDLVSRVSTFAISVPLLYQYRFNKSFALSVGGVVNFNVLGKIHNYYDLGDDEYDITTKKIGHNPVTVDLMGIVHLAGIGIYCKYSPMKVFKTDRGPEFKSLSVGLYF